MDLLTAFGKTDKIFLPVIHVQHEEQAILNLKIARDSGADGAFLINHSKDRAGISPNQLLSVYDWVKDYFPDFYIGLNCLGVGLMAIEKIPHYTQGLWADERLVDIAGPTPRLSQFEALRRGKGWKGLYFGSVAFKYQDGGGLGPTEEAALARKHADVIVTSGEKTGKPPSVDKIRTMREAIGDHPLAIASGMTPENVLDYVPYTNIFMVATGISDSFTELSPGKTSAFRRRLDE